MEWKEVRLGDVCSKITDGSHFSPKAQTEGYPMLSVKDMREYDFDFSNCKKISYEDYLKMERDGCVPQIGDVLVAKDGSYLKEIFICKEQREIALLSSIAIFRPNSQLIDSRFLCYCLKSPRVYNYISLNCVSGSALPRIILKDFKGVNIRVPSLEDQRRIASILSSLDRKIELNNKINADLEEMAQAIFKNWFVDFEPFKDGKFVDSELGMIPEGWKVGGLFDIAEIFDKKRKPLSGNVREKMDKIYPYYGATSCMDYVDDYIFDGIYTLIGEDGSVVKENGLPYMQYVWGKMWVNNHAHILQGKNGYSTEMIHALLSITNIKFLVTGAVQAKLSQGNMQKILVAIPPKNVLDEIRPVIDNLYSKIRINTDENSRLSLLRDTLLPRLISGEIEVPE